MTTAAIASLGGLVVTIVLYTFYPLPAGGAGWQASTIWLPLLLLGVGLVCFIILLISGLIVLLNWGSDRSGRDQRER